MYLKIAEVSLKESFAYRIEFIGGIISSLVQLIVFWFVWTAVFTSGKITGITLPTMITYISISTILRTYGYSGLEFKIEDDVKIGTISNYLVRPFIYPIYCLFDQFGDIIASLMIVAAPVSVVAFLFLNVAAPADFLAFLISAVFGFFISYLLSFLTGMWAFWTTGNIWGVRMARNVISDFFSGAVIPLFLFPLWLTNIAYLMPFQAMYNTPLLIYIGKVSGYEIVNVILIQIFWITSLSLLSYLVWKRAETKVVVHGG